MKRLAVLAVLVGTAVAVPARAADDKVETSPYFPTKVGSTWTYKAANLPIDGKVVYKVVKHEKVGDTMCAFLELSIDGRVLPNTTDAFAVKKDGVYRYTLYERKLDTPVLVLKLPPKKGEDWKIDSKLGENKVSCKFTVTEEKLTVPAGKYDAFEVRGKVEVSGKVEGGSQTIELTNFYVKDIGIAKIKADIGGLLLEFELEKFEAGK
jgi:hypothetical protein